MRVLNVSASNGYAENGSTKSSAVLTTTSNTPTAATTTIFGNNNENYRTHTNSNALERSTNKVTTATVTTTPSHQQQQQQQNSHNSRTLAEKFNCEDELIACEDVDELREHQNNFITDTSTLDVADSLQSVDSSNNSFFDECVESFANLESYRRTSASKTEEPVNGPTLDLHTDVNKSTNHSGRSTPSFEEINLDNFALERELNRIIRGSSISEACEDDNSCNCKSLQESLKSYELIRDKNVSGLAENDDNVSADGGDDDYDDDQMDSHLNAESITRSSELSPDDSLMDDDDEEYLSSQASSCTSVSTPQRSHFPRGIINPNYPGFQHLAHTLSEHYISHQSSDPYDSDLSEYEMELSVDSFECDFLDVGTAITGTNNNNHNNNNNLNTMMVMNNNCDTQCFDETDATTLGDMRDGNAKPTLGAVGGTSITILPLISVTHGQSGPNSIADEEESSNLQTYLKLYDVTTQQQESEHEKSLEIEIPQDEGNYGCPTPDILIKNYNSERYSLRPKPENRPDLLRNVSPNPPMKCRFKATFQEDDDSQHLLSPERNSPPDTLRTESRNDTTRDDISLGLTPVDIVGDFGQEVEREFGLIVSGYNSRLEYVNYPTGAFYLYNVGERAQAEKMSDALLLNGTEQITSSKYSDHQNRHRLPNETDASTLDAEHNKTIETSKEENPRTSDTTHPQTLDQQSNNEPSSENSIKKFSNAAVIPSFDDSNLAHCSRDTIECAPEKHIPTAIVKPKYQKSSFDERQLPPIGLDFNVKSRAWFDCPKGSSTNARSAKKIQNSERNSRIFKTAKFARGNNNNTSTNRFGLTARRSSDKTKDSCMVAVVPPMMKETEDCQGESGSQLDHKPLEPHCTRYSFASWAASLRDSKRTHPKSEETPGAADGSACFDVYNIETALPEIDLDAIESHLKRANEEERRSQFPSRSSLPSEICFKTVKTENQTLRLQRRNDREEIRRRLAMGAEDDYFTKLVTNNVRPGRKPSLQSRLQNGKNLQICFMNEASSDTESHSSDSETCPKLSRMVTRNRSEIPKFFSSIDVPDHPYNAHPLSVNCTNNNARKTRTAPRTDEDRECDFFTRQARLQIEARMALSQAKDMAHMQMELDRQKQRLSPITGIIRGSLEKVGVVMAPEKRRVSRQMLTDMNIAQLQIIVNDLHTQIEDLNDSLVHYLMERDDLHMGQDSMLVDIEDISRFLSAKELEEEK